ncbi:S8 family serine peptidase [Acanthopleuribacter pedis]|uniref:S8 family serine peptidase n=1 Tax=Acanthopleuribacter pedis TaxID=442870 RepID=A0A8J7Q857_9BACT|nr:S8 family serine peptidase [Acanthopleuribacter pedis]MBO1319452.1 S8 family serine peptidase [Acanthopleuribacter pedis]
MSPIDSLTTLIQKHLLQSLKKTALWVGLGAGSLFAGPLPPPFPAPAETPTHQSETTTHETQSWILILAGEPLAASGSRMTARGAVAGKRDLTHQKQQLQNIRDQFLASANAGRSSHNKSAADAMQAQRTFENLIHGVVLHGNRADADRWAQHELVQGVYPNRRLQLQPIEQGTSSLTRAKAAAHGYDGSGQVIAILDSGIDYTHPDLGGGFGPGYKVIGGYEFIDNDTDPMDEHYHGTHVAGIAAADGDIQGIAPKAKLLAYRVLDATGSARMRP